MSLNRIVEVGKRSYNWLSLSPIFPTFVPLSDDWWLICIVISDQSYLMYLLKNICLVNLIGTISFCELLVKY